MLQIERVKTEEFAARGEEEAAFVAAVKRNSPRTSEIDIRSGGWTKGIFWAAGKGSSDGFPIRYAGE